MEARSAGALTQVRADLGPGCCLGGFVRTLRSCARRVIAAAVLLLARRGLSSAGEGWLWLQLPCCPLARRGPSAGGGCYQLVLVACDVPPGMRLLPVVPSTLDTQCAH